MGSTPTRPTRLIANFELRISNCGLRIWVVSVGAVENSRFAIRDSRFDNAREAQKAERSIGNREVASSIPAAGSGGTTADGRLTTVVSRRSSVIVMAKILPTVTADAQRRHAEWRFRILVRKLAAIKKSRGWVAQTAERRSHKSVAGGSIPPPAIRGER